MIDSLLTFIAPHICCGCGVLGAPICDNCKYDIIVEPFSGCLNCGRLTTDKGACSTCQVAYDRAWCVGERSGVLQRLIGNYKFQNMKAAHLSLADLLDQTIPELPAGTIIVPIPTVAAHIRERGYDHMRLIAERLAHRRGLVTQTLLKRKTHTTQRHAGRTTRLQQIKTAFEVVGVLDPEATYVIVDDVVTTGATLNQASKLLRQAGARSIWVAAIARQPID